MSQVFVRRRFLCMTGIKMWKRAVVCEHSFGKFMIVFYKVFSADDRISLIISTNKVGRSILPCGTPFT